MSSNIGATVVLRGRVATDPVTKVTSGGKDLTRFRVVCTRRYKDGDDNWIDGDEFGVWVVAWNGLGAASSLHLRKGDAVLIEGGVSSRPYDDKDGKPGWITEVRAGLVGLDVQWLRGRLDRTKWEKERGHSADVVDASVADEPEPADEPDLPPWDREAVPAG